MIYPLSILILLAGPNIQVLIDAKKWDEAEAQLATLSSTNRPRFEGLIAEGRDQPALAADAFERALVETPDVPEIHLHAAHAYFKLEQFEAVLRHARGAVSLRDEAVAQPLLEARALQALNRDSEAYIVLTRACEAYQSDPRPCFEFATLAHRKKLLQDVRRVARKLVALASDRDAMLPLFHLLYGDRDGLPILEQVVAQYPKDAEIRALLAHVYARDGRWFTAARLFEEATIMGGKYAYESADQYRMAGRYKNALRMNGQAASSQTQRVQRLSILFEQQRYARIVSMPGTFTEPAALYRVAYAHYAVGEHGKAKRTARKLLETSYAEEAAALLDAIRQGSRQ